MQIPVVAGATNVSVRVRIMDSTAGTPELTLDHTNGGTFEYQRDGAANATITLASLAALTTAHTDGGFEEIGNGWYRLDLPDAAVAVGVDKVIVHGAISGMIVYGPEIVLTDPVNGLFKSHVITSASTTALTVADFTGYANDELIGELCWVLDSSANEWHPAWCTDFTTSTGVVTVVSARDGNAMPFTSESGVDRLWRSGFSRAQLTAVSVSGAVGSVTGAVGSVTGAVGSVTGAVGSVTGAVGSVTGNVGGNVVGSVASVTGAVGSVTGTVGGIAGTITTLDALDTAQDTQHSTTQGRLPAALVSGRIDATVDGTGMESGAVTAVQSGLATAAALATVDANVDILVSGIISGFTAVTGTLSTTVCTTDITGYADDELIGRVIVFTGGTAAGQAAAITDYASTNGTVTFSGGVATAPVNLDSFVIV